MSMGKSESLKAETAVYNDPPIPPSQVIQQCGWNTNWAFSQALNHCINSPPQGLGEYQQLQQPQMLYKGNNINNINNNDNNNNNNGNMCSFMFYEEDPLQFRNNNNTSNMDVSEKLRLSLQAIRKQPSRSYSQELAVRKQVKRESPVKTNQPIRNGQEDRQLLFTGAKKHSGEVSFNSYNEELRNVKYTSVSYFCQNKRGDNERKDQQQHGNSHERNLNKNGQKGKNNTVGSQDDANKKNDGFLDNNSESSAMWGFRRLEEDRKYDWEVEDIIAQSSWRGGTVQSRVLGKGAFGNVIKATDNNTAEQYALKFLKRSFYSKAITETAIMKQFHDNAHIIQYHDVYLYDQQTESNQIIEVQQYLVIVMELAQASLEDILQLRMSCQAHWTGTELLSIFKHIASAVKSLAGKHIAHRDIKPSNILYCLNTKHYKLADFGEAKMVKTVDFEGSHSPRGTKKYMSPELLHGLQELQLTKSAKNENSHENQDQQKQQQQEQLVAMKANNEANAENIRVEEIPSGDVIYEPYANDIYSLGVCFFQLKFLEDLAQYKGRESKTAETEMYFRSRFHEEEDKVDRLISRMLDLNPQARPDINEVVSEIDQLIEDKTLQTEEDKIVVYAFKVSKEQSQQPQGEQQTKKNESQIGSTQALQGMNNNRLNSKDISQTLGNLKSVSSLGDLEKEKIFINAQGNQGSQQQIDSNRDNNNTGQEEQQWVVEDNKQNNEQPYEHNQYGCQSLGLDKEDVVNCDDALSWSKNMNFKVTITNSSPKQDQVKICNSDKKSSNDYEEEDCQSSNSDEEDDDDDDDEEEEDDMDSENDSQINIPSQNNPPPQDQLLIDYSNPPACSSSSPLLPSQVDESQFLKLMETKRASNLTVEQQIQHYIARAQAYENLLKFQKARDTFYELYQTYFSSLSARDQVRLLKNLGRLDHKMSKFDLAIRFYQQLLCILKSSNELQDKEVSDVYSMLGSACCCQGDYEAALRYYGESLAKKEQLKHANCIDDDAETADLLVYIGLVKKHLGEYASSLEYYERALAVVTKQSPLNTDLLRISAIKKHMGSIYDRLNNNHQSIACLEAALHDMVTANGYESERVVNCLNKLGIVLVHSGKHNHEAAIAHFENAMKIMKKLYKMDTISEATRKLFRFQDKPQDPNILPLYTRAFSVNEEAYILYRQVYDYYHLGVAVILEIRGMIYHFLNEFEYCLKYYSEALNIYSRILKPEHEFVKRSSAFVELAKNQQQFTNFPNYQVE